MTHYLHGTVYFLCKNSTFVTEKSDQDPIPHDTHWFGSLVSSDPDPDPRWGKHWIQIRIHIEINAGLLRVRNSAVKS